MDDIENYCFQLYRSQGMLAQSNLRASRGSYDIMLILRGVAPSIRPYVATRKIRMPLDGVL